MKMNAPRRNIVHDVIDLIPVAEAPTGDKIVELPIDLIVSFHDHHFHLYTGERLNDMVDSIRCHGILVPVIVQKIAPNKYEMLAGHNRLNAANIAGLTTVPAIIKEGLSEKEAWQYVMETNLYQRSFDDMLPSEQAAILLLEYDKMSNQGKRNDIAKELAILDGTAPAPKDEEKGKSTNSRKELAERYSMSSASVARLLRINYLITDFKLLLDAGKLSLLAGVEISYLKMEEQLWLNEFLGAYTYRVDKNAITMLRQRSKIGGLDKDSLWALLISLDKQKNENIKYQTVKVSKNLYQKYFKETSEKEIEEIMSKALELYYKNVKDKQFALQED